LMTRRRFNSDQNRAAAENNWDPRQEA